jgi:hypothetical protein
MSTNDAYLAIFLGSKTSPKMMAWNSLPETERRAKEREGIAAWKAGMGRKAPGRDRRHGWTARQDQEDHSTRDRRYKQRHGSLRGRPSGIERGRRETFRKPSALHNLPWRIRGGDAGLTHTWSLIAREQRQAGDRSANSDPTTSITACCADSGRRLRMSA